MTASGASIRGPHEIADLHIGGADPSGKRRANDGVALLDLQIVQRGLIRLDGADQDIGLGLGVIDIDLRGGALADQVAVTPDVALRAFELGLILGEHALGLLDLGVDLTRVERKQQIALVDLGAVFEMHRDDGGLDPRFQRHAGDRRDRSDRIDIDRHRLAHRLGQFDRDHARPRRSLHTGCRRPAMKRGFRRPSVPQSPARPPKSSGYFFSSHFTSAGLNDRDGPNSPAP